MAVKLPSALLSCHSMDAMYLMDKQLVAAKGASKDHKKNLKMLKDAAEERRHTKAKEFNERH